MLSDVLHARIREYAPANAIEQENMLAELMQHYVLASLSRSGLFSAAMFHGGTCLRICRSMSRFSEDLDFLLKQPARQFVWEPHLQRIVKRRACGSRFRTRTAPWARAIVGMFRTGLERTLGALSQACEPARMLSRPMAGP